MNEKHEAHLARHYPTLYPKGAGIDTGDGWFRIVDILSRQLEWLNGTGAARITYLGSKEKFGTLRYDVIVETIADDFPCSIVWTLTEDAESQSGLYCEECGAFGERREGGWIKTLCDACDRKRKAQYETEAKETTCPMTRTKST